MDINKIILKNPIDYNEIDALIIEIVNGKDNSFLMIDFGNHDFETFYVIKYCREKLQSIEPCLLEYKKIAMIHPPQYKNISDDENKLKYFTSEAEATYWFLD